VRQVLEGEGGLAVSNPALALPIFHVHAQPRAASLGHDAGGGSDHSSGGLRGYPSQGQVAGAHRLVPLTAGWVT
jgi:hypothetical protein